METINSILAKLQNKVTPSIAKRLDGLQALKEKSEVAREEHETEPTEESLAELNEILEYIEDTEQDLIEDMVTLFEKKQREAKRVSENAVPPIAPNVPAKEEEKEKSGGMGVVGIVLGGLLLVGSLGAINYFKNNR
ncbi:MAG: hypothetical protein WCJ62_13295 [Flavobacterium sp.]